ncbi:hypothetical protein BKA82DRAFT_4186031 [Pisolithus tinctorius]|nr:hypothetical protein BKA82DRAFT_4186031 [Pisolithus tinctorius]
MIDVEPCPGCCTGPLKYMPLDCELWLPWTRDTPDRFRLKLDDELAWLDKCSGPEILMSCDNYLWAVSEPDISSWAIMATHLKILISNVAGTYSKICRNLVSIPRIRFVGQLSLVYPAAKIWCVACGLSTMLPWHLQVRIKAGYCINQGVTRFRITKNSSCC